MENYKVLYKKQGMPLFQNCLFDDYISAQQCARGDIELVQDMCSGLVYNQAFDPSLLQYNKDYQAEQEYSSAYLQHLKDVESIIRRNFLSQKILEVGCGKGYLLESLQSAGFDIVGVDPSYEGKNKKIIKESYRPDLVPPVDVIIIRHTLEHIQNPGQFLQDVQKANKGTGKVYIEAPCFDWMLKNKMWTNIFYEYVNYFRLGDIAAFFDTVHDSGYLFNNQYFYLVGDLSSLKTPEYGARKDIVFPCDFTNGATKFKHILESIKNVSADTQIVVWGGASKGVVFCIFMHEIGISIDFVVDVNPAKQKKYMPVTGLRIDSPEFVLSQLNRGDVIVVMNENYLDEIRSQAGNDFLYYTMSA